jgi:hypothetical protein
MQISYFKWLGGAVLGPVHVRIVVDELALRYFPPSEYYGFPCR